MRAKAILQFAAVAIAMTAVGCESNNKGKIEGTKWTNDAGTVDGKAVPANFIRLEFGSDGKLTYDLTLIKYTGTYSLGMGDTVTLNLDQELAGRKQHAEKVSINGDKLTMSDSNGSGLTFSKVVENQPQAPLTAPPANNKKGGGGFKGGVK
jgi:hypothetical protein